MDDDSPARTISREINLKIVERLSTMMDFAASPELRAPAGRLLAPTGTEPKRLPLIVIGTIDAVVHQSSDDGNSVVLVSWGEGELAMLSQLFSTEPASADLVAVEDLRYRWLSIAEVEQALLKDQQLLVLLVRFLAQRMREVQDRERGWLERGVHERVCVSLARIVRAMPSLDGKRVMIASTHESLAARCGVSRPRLSRELKRLEDDGLLQLGRGTIEVLDRDRLESAAAHIVA